MSNPLSLVPAKYRGAVYFLAWVVGLAWTAYEAAHEDWRKAVPIFLGTLVAALAHSNVGDAAPEVEGD